MELLVERGADVNALWDGHYLIIFAPCETLQAGALKWLIEHGANHNVTAQDGTSCVRMLVGTYSRNPEGKHGCLAVFADFGYQFPDTAPMAIHRGRIDLLAACLARDPTLLDQPLSESEIFPAALGLDPGDGLHCAPLDGGTLLHMAVEFHEAEVVQWLIERGADVNGRAAIDGDGFGGHTPLFHTTVTLGPKTDALARLLLAHGARPNDRATFRKALRWEGDAEKERMREYHDATAIDFARQFQEPRFVNEAAIAAIRENGGQ